MSNYESELFRVAPWVIEVMQVAKTLNDNALMRTRSGWIKHGIHDGEIIYEHSCKLGLAAHYLFGDVRLISKAVIHDFPEIFTQDYMPGEISPKLKREKEQIAMQKVKSMLPNGEYWYNHWQEFEARKTIKDQQLFELDKMDPCIQAIMYSKLHPHINLNEFQINARLHTKTPQLVNLLDEMHDEIILFGEDTYDIYFEKLRKLKLRK